MSEALRAAQFAFLEKKKNQLKKEGTLAPERCYVSRYQAKGQQKAYWYYKLQASSPIFPTAGAQRCCAFGDRSKFSRYKHLGAAGTKAHIDAVIEVVRRVQVEELQKAIDSLKESWLDLYSSEKENTQKK